MLRVFQLIVAVYLCFASSGATRADEVRILVEKPLPTASARALQELREALTARGDKPTGTTLWSDHAVPTIVVGFAGSPGVDALLALANKKVPPQPESALIASAPSAFKSIVIAGHDDRGLSYALRDAARAIAVTPKENAWHEELTFAIEKPFLKVRNVSLHLFNADCEREWFFSEEYWRFYFQRLSLSRFNRCTLTFCDQTNYLCPPYAYLVDMPEYPDVKVADCTTEQRAVNGKMLKRIAELADEYAIDFDLGIWMQAPVEKWASQVQVTGLPDGMELAKYCALGLRRILEACPSIDGLQLRMNAEAGVPEDQQTAFYKPMFQALAVVQAKQRPDAPYRLELRYKGLTDETIRAARDEKLDVTVSTKYWAEHFGLPYHPTVVDSHYAKDRYSFGTLLRKPRDYRITYQLWTVGSQRLTLWGDPDYAKRFAESCTLGGGEGFEVFAPLTNKGYGNKPGAWPVIKSPEHRVGKWEQERYWAFYLAFGRLGYNPNTPLDFWHREFRHRFGEAAMHVEQAYRDASRILPTITTALLPSASEWYWWPEMDTGDGLAEYSRTQTSDPGRYAAIRRWERTPAWRCEEWDATPGTIENWIDGKLDARYRVSDMYSHLQSLCSTVEWNRKQAAETSKLQTAEQRMTDVDLRLLAGLAAFHSAKYRAAVDYAVFEATADRRTRERVPCAFDEAAEAWKRLVTATDGVYHDDLVFGITLDMPRSKQGHHHSGHWRDRLPEIESELQRLRDGKLEAPNRLNSTPPQDRLFGPPLSSGGKQIRLHEPPTSFDATQPLTLRIAVDLNVVLDGDDRPPTRVKLLIRPLDQTRPWRELEMELESREGKQETWQTTVPVAALDPHFDVQYYYLFAYPNSKTLAWPYESNWMYRPPYFVVPVEAK